MGICHAIGKSVIIVSSIKDEIPFDVGSKNIVIYKDIDSLKSQLKDELLKMFIDESSIWNSFCDTRMIPVCSETVNTA